jgi:hypothetical protein
MLYSAGSRCGRHRNGKRSTKTVSNYFIYDLRRIINKSGLSEGCTKSVAEPLSPLEVPKIEKKKKKKKIFLPMNLTTFFVVAINDNKINLFLLFFILFSL